MKGRFRVRKTGWRIPVDRRLVDAELNAIDTVAVGRTVDRSITGQLVDFAKLLSFYLPTDARFGRLAGESHAVS
jgi:hypothetical protein